MLQQRFDIDKLNDCFLTRKQWQPFPPASDRKAWEELLKSPLNQQRKAYLVGKAEALTDRPWPQITASMIMNYHRHADSSEASFEGYAQRRERLTTLVLAECFEHQGRFMDDIANGIWAITEEASWNHPAHDFWYVKDGGAIPRDDILPSQHSHPVSLTSGSTASLLTETGYLLQDELAALSPGFGERIKQKVIERIIVPVETRDDFWWFEGLNNWSPYCSVKVLESAMYLLDDNDRLTKLTSRLIEVVDRFIDGYGPDGGCDEGPGYWAIAAGALLLFLELLHSRSNGVVNIYDEPLIRNMGLYIVRACIDLPWCINFADASAELNPPQAVTYRFGERIGSAEMKNLALLAMRQWEPDNDVWPLFDRPSVRNLFWVPADVKPTEMQLSSEDWLPDLQVLVARQSTERHQGLVLAAKGGHNQESHNHNDVGQFIIHLDGDPVVIDLGKHTYTVKTFGPYRWDIWSIRASGHNVPLVNGVEQQPGPQYKAGNVAYEKNQDGYRLAMNLENTYSAKADLKSLRREFLFQTADSGCISVTDSYTFKDAEGQVAMALYSPVTCQQVDAQTVRFVSDKRSLLLKLSPEIQAEVTVVELDDDTMKKVWGDKLHRIMLTWNSKTQQGSYTLRFTPEDAKK